MPQAKFYGFDPGRTSCKECDGPHEYTIDIQHPRPPHVRVALCAEHVVPVLVGFCEPLGAEQPTVRWPLGKADSERFIPIPDALRQLGAAV